MYRITAKARGAVAGAGAAAPVTALGAGAAQSRLQIDVRGDALARQKGSWQ